MRIPSFVVRNPLKNTLESVLFPGEESIIDLKNPIFQGERATIDRTPNGFFEDPMTAKNCQLQQLFINRWRNNSFISVHFTPSQEKIDSFSHFKKNIFFGLDNLGAVYPVVIPPSVVKNLKNNSVGFFFESEKFCEQSTMELISPESKADPWSQSLKGTSLEKQRNGYLAFILQGASGFWQFCWVDTANNLREGLQTTFVEMIRAIGYTPRLPLVRQAEPTRETKFLKEEVSMPQD